MGALFFLVGHGTLHWAEQHVASGLAALLILASIPLPVENTVVLVTATSPAVAPAPKVVALMPLPTTGVPLVPIWPPVMVTAIPPVPTELAPMPLPPELAAIVPAVTLMVMRPLTPGGDDATAVG